jgi:hypothetical protein
MKFFASLLCGASLLLATPVFADGHAAWKSVADESRVAFGSIKKNTAGEVHHFNTVSGTVSETGELALTIDLASVETNIDIRNERMGEHVFQKGAATAVVTGTIDMEEVSDLKQGETRVVEIEATLAFAGSENDIDVEMLVAKLSENRVLVTTADFIMLSTEDLGIDAGVDMLMKLAKLPGITRVTPVAVRMVFEK